MDRQQEHEVALGLREGRPEAWRALYDAYARPVWELVARRMGPGSTEVGDVVQETFLAAARSAAGYDSERGSLWLWLSGIARKHVALHFRKQQRHDRPRTAGEQLAANNEHILRWLEGGDDRPTEALESQETATLVRTTLGELPVDYEMLLTAKYFDGATVEEIAGAEKASATAVRSKLARARRAFRQAFLRASACCDEGQARGYHAS